MLFFFGLLSQNSTNDSFLRCNIEPKKLSILGALNTGGVDKQSLIFSNDSCCFAPQAKSSSFFNRRIGLNASTFPDKFTMKRLK
jgi:hypothetical protein